MKENTSLGMGGRHDRQRRLPALLLFLLCLSGPCAKAAGDTDVDKLLRQGDVDEAMALCSQLQGFEAAWSWPLVGDYLQRIGDLEAALACYQRGIPVIGLARVWTALAERSLGQGGRERAREEFGNAARAYETLIRDDRCIWDPAWNEERLAVRARWRQLGGDGMPERERERLNALLRRAAEYCRRLEGALLNFICEEEVVETFDHSQPLAEVLLGPALAANAQGGIGRDPQRRLYDYQLVSLGEGIREQRILLRKSAKATGVQTKDLIVSHYSLSKMIYTPIEIFAASQSLSFDYRILGEERDAGGLLTIIEAIPLEFMVPPLSFGKAWLREDGRVERIDLNFKSIQHYEEVAQAARWHKRLPAITFVIHFGKVFKGLGFPSVIRLRDAFLDANGRESLVSSVDITYDQFRFHTVETREEIQELK